MSANAWFAGGAEPRMSAHAYLGDEASVYLDAA